MVVGVESMEPVKGKERVFAIIGAVIVLGGMFAVLILDGGYDGPGGQYLHGEINSWIILENGQIEGDPMPDDLIVLGAGQNISLKFPVYNLDPDTDIDTISITIPGSKIVSGSYQWYNTNAIHEWDRTISEDSITLVAQDDFVGSEAGDSAYYETSGSIDDALDFIKDYSDGDNPVYDLSEGLTVTVSFTAPGTTGFKIGTDSIDLKVGDIKTEDSGVGMTSFEPFPYPFVVAENEDSFLLMVLKTPSCDMDVIYGGESLFGSTRAAGFRTSSMGFEYCTEEGETVAIISDPGDTKVKPLVWPKDDGSSGDFVLDVFKMKVSDIASGYSEITPIATDYKDRIPGMGEYVDNDMDDDGTFNKLDTDMDGDNISNDEDPYPSVFNRPPVIIDRTDNLAVKESDAIAIMVEASDPDSDTLTYNWTNDKDPTWKKTGSKIILSGLEPGTYVFTVEINDKYENIKVESIVVTVTQNEPPVIHGITKDLTKVHPGDQVTITVNVTDTENDHLTYVWSNDRIPGWSGTGNPLMINGLEEGENLFTVTISDGWSNTTSSLKVKVEAKGTGGSSVPLIPIIIAVIVILLVVVAIVTVILVKRRKTVEAPEPNEGPIQPNLPQASPEDSYKNFFDQAEPGPADETNRPLEITPAEPADIATEQSHEGANVMEFPTEGSGGSQQQPLPSDAIPSAIPPTSPGATSAREMISPPPIPPKPGA